MTTVAESPAQPRRRGARYHHGDLKAAMVEATIALVQAVGVGQVSVREAARRAGVSSGAPFRHFPTRAALLTAAAEEAMRRFRAEIDAAMAEAADADPLERLSALAFAYLRWGVRNPSLFEILGDRRGIDLAAGGSLSGDIAELQAVTGALLAEAAQAGLLRTDDIFNLTINARTLAYGTVRMFVDRQLAEWGVADSEAEAVMARAFRTWLETIARDPGRHRWRV
jgi:AcrR family transcriptional regulator